MPGKDAREHHVDEIDNADQNQNTRNTAAQESDREHGILEFLYYLCAYFCMGNDRIHLRNAADLIV